MHGYYDVLSGYQSLALHPDSYTVVISESCFYATKRLGGGVGGVLRRDVQRDKWVALGNCMDISSTVIGCTIGARIEALYKEQRVHVVQR